MYFVISKTLGLLVKPHYLCLFLLGVALALRLVRARPGWRRGLVIGALGWIWLTSCGVVANTLLYPLETRYRRPAELGEAPSAIVMLGGMLSPDIQGTAWEFNMAADRFVETLRLAHLYPRARVVLSGGSGALLDQGFREAEALRSLMQQLKISESRIFIDKESRNTRENALRSRELLVRAWANASGDPQVEPRQDQAPGSRAAPRGSVLLVTSAYHMPRAMACFARVGLRVIPWPTDFQRTSSASLSAFVPSPAALQLSEAAIHEYVGWLTYMIAGYI